jgi:hypothetical protein
MYSTSRPEYPRGIGNNSEEREEYVVVIDLHVLRKDLHYSLGSVSIK